MSWRRSWFSRRLSTSLSLSSSMDTISCSKFASSPENCELRWLILSSDIVGITSHIIFHILIQHRTRKPIVYYTIHRITQSDFFSHRFTYVSAQTLPKSSAQNVNTSLHIVDIFVRGCSQNFARHYSSIIRKTHLKLKSPTIPYYHGTSGMSAILDLKLNVSQCQRVGTSKEKATIKSFTSKCQNIAIFFVCESKKKHFLFVVKQRCIQ